MAERTNAPSARNVYIYRQDHHQRLVVGLQWLGREAAGFVTRGSKSIPAMSQRLESREWTFNLTSFDQDRVVADALLLQTIGSCSQAIVLRGLKEPDGSV